MTDDIIVSPFAVPPASLLARPANVFPACISAAQTPPPCLAQCQTVDRSAAHPPSRAWATHPRSWRGSSDTARLYFADDHPTTSVTLRAGGWLRHISARMPRYAIASTWLVVMRRIEPQPRQLLRDVERSNVHRGNALAGQSVVDVSCVLHVFYGRSVGFIPVAARQVRCFVQQSPRAMAKRQRAECRCPRSCPSPRNDPRLRPAVCPVGGVIGGKVKGAVRPL